MKPGHGILLTAVRFLISKHGQGLGGGEPRRWRDRAEVKNTCLSCRGLRAGSQPPHDLT